MQQRQVFRKVSLDRLSSPEQLDQLMQVTDRRGWIALTASGVVILVAIVWGLFGQVPEKVSGMGMLIKSGGVFEVIPSAGGRVTDVAVMVGDLVTEGQVIARVEQPAVADQLDAAKNNLEALRTEHEHLLAFGAKDIGLQQSLLERQRLSAQEAVKAGQATMRALRDRLTNQEQLVKSGLLTTATLLNTRQQYDAATEKVQQDSATIGQLDVKKIELTRNAAQDVRSSQIKIDAQTNTVAQLERELQNGSEVRAPYSGRILEIMTDRGSMVAPGEALLSLDLTGKTVKDLEAVIYVPSVHGKQVRPGMQIQIAPSTVKQEEFGLMLGRVTYVSDFPATSKGMRRVLKNERLVSEMSGQDAPYEVHADLVVDPTTRSQYKWSSSGGPPTRIQSGTLALGHIEVTSRRPAEMVIPLLKRYLGI